MTPREMWQKQEKQDVGLGGWKNPEGGVCDYEHDLAWIIEHVSVHSVVAYMQWLIRRFFEDKILSKNS